MKKTPTYLTLTEFAKAISIHPQTVRKWDKSGQLPAQYKTPGGHRYYTKDQVTDYFNGEYQK